MQALGRCGTHGKALNDPTFRLKQFVHPNRGMLVFYRKPKGFKRTNESLNSLDFLVLFVVVQIVVTVSGRGMHPTNDHVLPMLSVLSIFRNTLQTMQRTKHTLGSENLPF